MKRNASLVLLGGALLFLAAACQTIRPMGSPSGRTPVIFVHGYAGDETVWNAAVQQFEAAGYAPGDITVISYDTNKSAHDAAVDLATEVDYLRNYTGKSKVDVVSHSYGSMVTKYCIELGSCSGKVSHWVSLAGADNGTSTSALCTIISASCADMAGQTSTIADLQAAWPNLVNQGVKVEVQWSPTDGTINPATSSIEPTPALAVQLTGGQTHTQIPSDAGVLAEAIRFLGT